MIRDISRAEVARATEVLTNAFRDDALFQYFFGDPGTYERLAPPLLASWVNWSRLYGKAWMTEDRNAVAIRQVPGGGGFGFWNTLRAGMLLPILKLDAATRRRLSVVSSVVVDQRASIMGRNPYWYCWMMGVEPTLQRQGVGRQLMRHTFEQADRSRLPCYLETFSAKTVQVHTSQGYAVRESVPIPQSCLTLYVMIRPPRSSTGQE
jgi:GNAT superfamily N-acetyltransferase